MTTKSRQQGTFLGVDPFPLEVLLNVVKAQRELASRDADVTLVLGLTGLRFRELSEVRARDVVASPYPAIRVDTRMPRADDTPTVGPANKGGRIRLVPLSVLVLGTVLANVEGKDPNALLFPAPDGGRLQHQNWQRAIHWNTTGVGRRPNDLRHTAVSVWLAAGADLGTVSSWLGHRTDRLTRRTYGHLKPTQADRAALQRVNRALAGPTLAG